MATFPFNFKPQFAAAVLSGQKRQTIRRNRADGRRPVPGDVAKLYTGLRTSATQLLRQAPVVQCRGVRIYLGDGLITVDGKRMEGVERGDFARADGFDHWPAMLAFFQEQYGADGEVFEGFCVEWSV